MGVDSYYLSNNLVKGFGKMWFLQTYHAAEGDSGRRLLGSVVQEMKPFLATHYPMPFQMTTPEIIRAALERSRERLGIPAGDPMVLKDRFSGGGHTVTINKKDLFNAHAGPFPSIPASAQLVVDYARLASFSVSFDDTTSMEYIPTDYLARLYKYMDGDARRINPDIVVDIAGNYIVDQILVAKNFRVAFESTQVFDTEFVAQLSYMNATGGGQLKFSITDKKTLVAEIKGDREYVVAFKTIDWDDLG
jgi:hypothetical protein